MPDTRHPSDTSSLRNVLIILDSVGASILALMLISRNLPAVTAFTARAGLIGVAVILVLYVILAASPIPSDPITMIAAAIYGPVPALIIGGTGNTLAALVEYYLGGKINDMTRLDERRHELPFGLGRLSVTSPWFLLGARLVPWFGPKLVSVVAGIYRVDMGLYIWTTLIPTFLGSAAFAFGGFGLVQIL
jgi:uncharacterized membrane protein YdjX (TVP38/TMEM64 family)